MSALRLTGALVQKRGDDTTKLDFSNSGYIEGTSLRLTGDLIVNGSQTILNTAQVDVEDSFIQLSNGSTLSTLATADTAGILFGTTNQSNITVGTDDFRFALSSGDTLDLFALNNQVSDEVSQRLGEVTSVNTQIDGVSDGLSDEVSQRLGEVTSVNTQIDGVSDGLSDEVSQRTGEVFSLDAAIGGTSIINNDIEGLLTNITDGGTRITFGRTVEIGANITSGQPLQAGSNLTVNVGDGSSAAEFSVTDDGNNPLFVVQRNTDQDEGSVIVGVVNSTTFADESNQNVYLRYTAGNLTVQEDAGFGGYVTASVFDTASDENLKTNIENLTGALNAVLNLRGVTYNWKNGAPRQEVGVIAQDIQRHFPQIVHTHDNHLTVDYSRLTAVLIEAVKELDSRVKALEARA